MLLTLLHTPQSRGFDTKLRLSGQAPLPELIGTLVPGAQTWQGIIFGSPYVKGNDND